MYAEGLLANDAEQLQKELPVNDPEGSQHNQGEEDQHRECSQSADREDSDLRREKCFHGSRHSSRDTRGITSLSFLDLCRSQTARLPMTINCIVDGSKMLCSL